MNWSLGLPRASAMLWTRRGLLAVLAAPLVVAPMTGCEKNHSGASYEVNEPDDDDWDDDDWKDDDDDEDRDDQDRYVDRDDDEEDDDGDEDDLRQRVIIQDEQPGDPHRNPPPADGYPETELQRMEPE